MRISIVGLVGFASLLVVTTGQVFGTSISLPGTTGNENMLNAGFFTGGSVCKSRPRGLSI